MIDVNDYIRRAAKRCGFKREFYIERNIPANPANVLVIPFYGDLRSTFILSAYLLSSLKTTLKDKYVILCSWPGMRDLFPAADEYWSIEDESATKTLATGANNFYNASNIAADVTRGLMEVLDVMTVRDLKSYYDNGFTKSYWDTFGAARRFLPEVPSASKLAPDFRSRLERRPGPMVVVYPAAKIRAHQQGRATPIPPLREFWVALVERLLADGVTPLVFQNWFTHDLSPDFAERCVYLTPKSVSDALAAFRYAGCVLDVHAGVSKLAMAARCPFVAVTERQIFVGDRDYELDDLTCDGLPRQYIFGHAAHLTTGGPDDWNASVINNISVRLKEFLPTLKGATLPPTNESNDAVPYERVRQRKAKRIGAAFIRSSRNK
jgi:hypothetical protein